MLSIERSLVDRLPWLAQYPRIRRPMAGMLGRLADEDGFNRVLDRVGAAEGFDDEQGGDDGDRHKDAQLGFE